MGASVSRIPGVISADLNFASATLLVEYGSEVDPRAEIERVVASTGHALAALDAPRGEQAEDTRSVLDRYRSEIATAGSGAFTGLGIALDLLGAPEPLVVASFVVAIIFGGLLVWRRALVSLKARSLDMNVLMTIAVFGAAALGEWGEGATVYFLFALGGLLESRSLERTRRSIRDLMDLSPEMARVSRGGAFIEVEAADVLIGESVLVRPGERVPLDGVISSGASAFDESPITGESVPAEKSAGDAVFAGTLNTTGLVELRVTALADGSMLARIVHLVEEAQAAKAPSQRFVDRFSRWYTPFAVALAAFVAIVPPLVLTLAGAGGSDVWAEWVHRGLVVLVVSCPCALVISTPVSIVSGITRATRDGVLVKGGAFLEMAAKVKAVAFDKTGTLTAGRPEVADVFATAGRTRDEVLGIAGALEAHSNHPVARAVVRATGAANHPGVSEYQETPGRGVSGIVGGVEGHVGSLAWAEESARVSDAARAAATAADEAGRTALVVVLGGDVIGVISVADQVRGEAASVIARLHADGIEHTVMLTGDNERVAEGVASQVGVKSFLARLLPAAKTEAIGVLRQRYGVVAMVGDGVNDAPALALADIGIAMGAAGTDTALETADVALMRDDLSALPGFFDLSRRTVRTIIENVAFSIGVKAIFLGLAVTGNATLWMAVFADTGVSLLVILNGMRLLRHRSA